MIFLHKAQHNEYYLEAFILKDFLDGNQFWCITELSLVHHTKWSIANDFGICVGNFLGFVWPLTWSGHHSGHFATVFAWKELDTTMHRVISYNTINGLTISHDLNSNYAHNLQTASFQLQFTGISHGHNEYKATILEFCNIG